MKVRLKKKKEIEKEKGKKESSEKNSSNLFHFLEMSFHFLIIM
jgi:hypothetical protein